MRPLLRLLVVTAAAAVLAGCLPGSESSDVKRVSEELPRVPAMVVLDASGSMKDDDAPGVRFVAAQKAVRSLIGALSDAHEIGLVAYGTSTGSADDEAAAGCRDIETVVPFGKLDKKAFTGEVDGLKPSGYTPIGESLKQAAAALPDDAEKTAIVLVSDGIDTCFTKDLGPDPCEVAKDLKKERPGLAINTVGFKVTEDPAAREQLSCIAEATDGLDLDAGNGRLLTTRFLASFDPARAATSLQPTGYRGLVPGMSVEAARKVAPKLGDVSAKGKVEIVYVDCTVVFDDGRLVAIIPRGEKVQTLDGIGVGSDIGEAEKLFTDATQSATVGESTMTYLADAERGTGYRVDFEPSSSSTAASPKGKITRIVLCLCAPPSPLKIRVDDLPAFGAVAQIYPVISGGTRDVYPSSPSDRQSGRPTCEDDWRTFTAFVSGRWASYDFDVFDYAAYPTVDLYGFATASDARRGLDIVRTYARECEGTTTDEYGFDTIRTDTSRDRYVGYSEDQTSLNSITGSSRSFRSQLWVVKGRYLVGVNAQSAAGMPDAEQIRRTVDLAARAAGRSRVVVESVPTDAVLVRFDEPESLTSAEQIDATDAPAGLKTYLKGELTRVTEKLAEFEDSGYAGGPGPGCKPGVAIELIRTDGYARVPVFDCFDGAGTTQIVSGAGDAWSLVESISSEGYGTCAVMVRAKVPSSIVGDWCYDGVDGRDYPVG